VKTNGTTIGATGPALVGFNDGLMDQSGVAIATMRVPTFTMGVQAARAVLDKINRPSAGEPPAGPVAPIVVPFVFTEGETCVPTSAP
jgi:DNA-binding LacI/PurR family transcriptional regulator